MQFRAGQYYQVSLERMVQARKMYRDGAAFALAVYCGGLAVESLLRAFRWTEDTSFEGRHDLSELLKASKLLMIDRDYMRSNGASEQEIHDSVIMLHAVVNEVISLWHNNLRYASEVSFKRYLNKIGRFRGIKGDPLKKNTLDFLETAQKVIDRGVIMDVKDKIVDALFQDLQPEYVRLEDDDGISGFIVSRQFKHVSALGRQLRIEGALDKASLTQKERRQVLMIAGLTPEEYDSVGARIRVQQVKQMAGGAVEIFLHGGLSDAEYVRGSLNNQKGIQTTEPKQVPGALGTLVSFRAKGTEAAPLTKQKTIRALKKDRYIEVMPNA